MNKKEFDLAFEENKQNKMDNILFISTKKLNDKKLQIFLDDGFFMPVYKSEYYKYFKNDSIELLRFEQLHKTIINRGKKRIFYLLSEREYTIYEIKIKLERAGYHSYDTEKIISYFTDLGYLDDYAYAQKYIDYYKDKKSHMKIREKLLAKKINSSIIRELISDIDNADSLQYDLAYGIALKKYNTLNSTSTSSKNMREKLYRHLMGKGYDYNIISKILLEFDTKI